MDRLMTAPATVLREGDSYLNLTRNNQTDLVIGHGLPTHRHEPPRYRIESIPYYASDVHLWDEVECTSAADGDHPRVIDVVRASGFRTLRISLHPINFYLDRQAAWRKHPIHNDWPRLGLMGERWWVGDQVEGAVFAIPPSYNIAKIDLMKQRHTDLCIELV